MASASQPSAYDGDRDPAASMGRRQILTRRGSQDAPPRVVLHLPDLEALSAVALGPPQPAARRRIDPSHAPVSAAATANSAAASETPSLVKLLKAPFTKVVSELSQGNGATLAKWIAIIQQPKMLLAAILAVALQLAAVLAMMGGGSKPATQPGSPTVQEPTVVWPTAPSTIAGNGTVQTPISSPSFGYPGSASSGPGQIVTTPTLPPPQTLPGLDARDLPPWPSDATLPQPSLPQLVGPTPAANQPAKLTSPTPAAPTLAPPRMTAPIVETNPPAAAPTAELPSPAAVKAEGSTPATAAAQTGEAGTGRAKARLQGTIKKASVSGAAP